MADKLSDATMQDLRDFVDQEYLVICVYDYIGEMRSTSTITGNIEEANRQYDHWLEREGTTVVSLSQRADVPWRLVKQEEA